MTPDDKAREIACEIVGDFHPDDRHSLGYAIVTALSAARREAIEEAAKVARDELAGLSETIAAAIRALKDKQP